jgi:hypothetical protein
LELFSKARMSLVPDRIRGMDQLRAILTRAKVLEAV